MFWDFVPPSLNAAFALPALSSYFSKNKPKKKEEESNRIHGQYSYFHNRI